MSVHVERSGEWESAMGNEQWAWQQERSGSVMFGTRAERVGGVLGTEYRTSADKRERVECSTTAG
jgi:hypothetical protein